MGTHFSPPSKGAITVATPSFPLTTATYTNTLGVTVIAYITNGAAAMSTVVNGNAGPTIAASGQLTLLLPPNGTFKPTYASGTPSWVFQGSY